jgi:Mn2+/Fe2+ NRAMP family transporter
MIGGLAIDFIGLDAVKMMFWSAVVNGDLAPPLILLVVLLTSEKRVMGGRVNSLVIVPSGLDHFRSHERATVGMLLS